MAQDKIPKSQNCPACNKPCQGHSPTRGPLNAVPSPKDLVICFSCGNPLIYTHSLRLRRLTKGEYLDLDPGLRAELLMARQRLQIATSLGLDN